MAKLNQVIAIEKGVKSRVNNTVTTCYKAAQKQALFDGFNKHWAPVDEDGEKRPNEKRRVQVRVENLLETVSESLTELFDVTAQKDFANTKARANIVVAGNILLQNVPSTYLLFLEKQLVDIRTFATSLPTLSPDEDWSKDEALNLFKTEPVSTRSTAKVQEPILLAPATKEHPAQTQLITKDVVVGHWNTAKQSGATTDSAKKKLVRKVEELIKAVKYAREEANSVEAEPQRVGATIFSYLFD